MKTMITLDEDIVSKLRQVARKRGISFKAALKGAVRLGLAVGATPSRSFRARTRPLGIRPGVDVDKALSLAAEIEDTEILRKLELRK